VPIALRSGILLDGELLTLGICCWLSGDGRQFLLTETIGKIHG